MSRLLRILKFQIRSSFQGLIRYSTTAISAISAVSVTLILMSVFAILAGNINNFTYRIEDDFMIRASVDSIVEENEIATLQKQIEAMDGVKSVTFRSKDEELRALKEENEHIFGMYEEGDANPMRNTFVIETQTPEQIESLTVALQGIEGIESAEYGGDGISIMIELFSMLRNGGMIFVAGLAILAVFLISNTIRMTIYARKTEIGIMRNVGAGNWFIRIPFLIEGWMIGCIGSLLPLLLTYFGYAYFYKSMNGYFLSNMFVLKPVAPFAIQICLTLLISGMIVGVLGSFLAVSKYLRWKR